MLQVAGGWAFATLIYFKVAFDYGVSEISIIASILLGLTFGVFVFSVSGIYAIRLLPYNWTPGKVQASLGQLVGRTMFPLLGAFIAYSIIARLIIFGFSKRLSGRIEFLDYRDRIDETGIAFLIIVAIPVVNAGVNLPTSPD